MQSFQSLESPNLFLDSFNQGLPCRAGGEGEWRGSHAHWGRADAGPVQRGMRPAQCKVLFDTDDADGDQNRHEPRLGAFTDHLDDLRSPKTTSPLRHSLRTSTSSQQLEMPSILKPTSASSLDALSRTGESHSLTSLNQHFQQDSSHAHKPAFDSMRISHAHNPAFDSMRTSQGDDGQARDSEVSIYQETSRRKRWIKKCADAKVDPYVLILLHIDDIYGANSWRRKLLSIQSQKKFTIASFALFFMDITLSIVVLTLENQYPACTAALPLIQCQVSSVNIPQQMPICQRSESHSADIAVIVLTLIIVLLLFIFLLDTALRVIAYGKATFCMNRRFVVMNFLDLALITSALGFESFIAYEKVAIVAGAFSALNSLPALLILLRLFRYFQLAVRINRTSLRIHRARNLAPSKSEISLPMSSSSRLDGNRNEEQISVEEELQDERERQLTFQASSGEFSRPGMRNKTLALETSAKMLVELSMLADSDKWRATRMLAKAAGVQDLSSYVEQVLKYRLCRLLDHDPDWFSSETNMAEVLSRAVKIKASLAMWPNALHTLLVSASGDKMNLLRSRLDPTIAVTKTSTGIRNLLSTECLDVEIQELGLGGFGPLALLVLGSSKLRRLNLNCKRPDMWFASGSNELAKSIARSSSLEELDLGHAMLPVISVERLRNAFRDVALDGTIDHILRATKLKSLSLAGNMLAAADADSLSSGRNISTIIAELICYCDSLEELDISGNDFDIDEGAPIFQAIFNREEFRARLSDGGASKRNDSIIEGSNSSHFPVYSCSSMSEQINEKSVSSNLTGGLGAIMLQVDESNEVQIDEGKGESVGRENQNNEDKDESQSANSYIQIASVVSTFIKRIQANLQSGDLGTDNVSIDISKRESENQHQGAVVHSTVKLASNDTGFKLVIVDASMIRTSSEKYSPPMFRLSRIISPISLSPLPNCVVAIEGDPILQIGELRELQDACMQAETQPNKFTGDGKFELITGSLQEATRGLAPLLRVSESFLRTGFDIGTSAILQEVTALSDPETSRLLDYILHEPASEAAYPNGIRDRGRNGERLIDFCKHDNASTAGLEEYHVVALRLYTTSAFKFINGPLRKPKGPHPLARTTSFLADAIKKLRAVHANSTESTLLRTYWRGMRNLDVTDSFMTRNQGGTEVAPMSTSTNLSVAATYGASKASLLFKVCATNSMCTGAELSWVSAFPTEEEVLFPPLTYLQPTGRTQSVSCGQAHFTIVEVTPNI